MCGGKKFRQNIPPKKFHTLNINSLRINLKAHKIKRGYSFVNTTSLASANSLDHHAQLLNMSTMMEQFSEQMEFLRSSIEIQ